MNEPGGCPVDSEAKMLQRIGPSPKDEEGREPCSDGFQGLPGRFWGLFG